MSFMDELTIVADELAPALCGYTYNQLTQAIMNCKSVSEREILGEHLKKVFSHAYIVYQMRHGARPESWLGESPLLAELRLIAEREMGNEGALL